MTTNWTYVFTLFWTVTFCLGWRIITSEDMLFYWVRKPFEVIFDRIQFYQDKLKLSQFNNDNSGARLPEIIFWCKAAVYLAKPFVLCITCMASIWGVAVFYVLNGISIEQLPRLIINCVAASFIQTFIWGIYVKHIQ